MALSPTPPAYEVSRLAARLLADRSAGLTVDADGRRYFRHRQVQFQTLQIDVADLRAGGWLQFDNQQPALAWQQSPSHREIVRFAAEASERYRQFYYRVFDVVVARALFGRDTRIFVEPFLRGGPLLDIGIPEDQQESSIPPALHQRILEEYKQSRRLQGDRLVFYLGEYLEGLTDDLIAALAPFGELWRQRDLRQRAIDNLSTIAAEMNASLDQDDALPTRAEALRQADQMLLQILKERATARAWRQIEDAALRHLLHRIARAEVFVLSAADRETALRGAYSLALEPALLALFQRARGALPLLQLARALAAINGQLHRLRLREIRLIRAGARNAGNVQALRRAQLESLAATRQGNLAAAIQEWAKIGDPADTQRIQKSLALCAATEQKIEAMYASPLTHRDQKSSATVEAPPLPDPPRRFQFAGQLDLSDGLHIGDPLCEALVLKQAREITVRRLRPVRRTTSEYSTIPDRRHGALTLNPVMRLWKDAPEGKRGGPQLVRAELNTKATVHCLLDLALLVDAELDRREVRRERIVREKRGPESLQNMLVLLLPGSCAPIREIHRLDFPDFRGAALGEARTPAELGVPPEEDGIVAGGWYQKFNHTLYYPVGGDNAQLLRIIYNATRAPGPPAFFFALGQFVHDCLADELIYYKSGEMTFRECIEDYYREEDRVRKNRGEKTGRRRPDNSRSGIRFMFAVQYSRLMLEALTASSQSVLRHPPTEQWIERHVGLPLLRSLDRDEIAMQRARTRSTIERFSA